MLLRAMLMNKCLEALLAARLHAFELAIKQMLIRVKPSAVMVHDF